jgi:predicted metal-binding protein
VECLSGCRHGCNIALSGPGKPGLRLHDLDPDHAEAVAAFAAAYAAHPAGLVGDPLWPEPLRSRVAARTPPPPRPAPETA